MGLATEELAIEELAIEEVAIEEVAIEEVAIEGLAIEEVATEGRTRRRGGLGDSVTSRVGPETAGAALASEVAGEMTGAPASDRSRSPSSSSD